MTTLNDLSLQQAIVLAGLLAATGGKNFFIPFIFLLLFVGYGLLPSLG